MQIKQMKRKKDKQKWKQKHREPITNVKNEICWDLNPVKGGLHTERERWRASLIHVMLIVFA